MSKYGERKVFIHLDNNEQVYLKVKLCLYDLVYINKAAAAS